MIDYDIILFLITDIISYFILFYLPSYYLWINRQPKPYSTYSYAYLVVSLIDHSPYIVDFRSAIWLPYDHRSVANTDTRFAPNILGRGCFISLWRQVWTASALSGLLIRRLAPKMEDAIVRSAHPR